MSTTLDPFRYHVNAPLDLNQDQWDSLYAIMDTFLGTLSDDEAQRLADKYANGPTGVDRNAILTFAKLKSTDLQHNQAMANGFLHRAIVPEKHFQLKLILSVLSTKPGTYALTGHYCSFRDLALKDRESVINNWRLSVLPPLRQLFKAFCGVSLHPLFANKENHVIHRAMGYPAKDILRSAADYQPPRRHSRLPMLTEQDLLTSWDCIVIGSGGGGGVMAAELAKAGKSVLVIDKGTYYHESEMATTEDDAFANMYENGGFFGTAEGNVAVLAGSTFGGGTTVNWSVSLKLQHYVREEWAKQGLSHFMSPKFSRDLERVAQRIGASTDGIEHNSSNQLFLDGCKKLGYHVEDAPQNTGGQAHKCAYCYAGCKDGIKHGTMATWLRDAQAHGARFIDRTKVLRVLIEDGKAVGVEAAIHHSKDGEQRLVQIYAKTVVCSAGSLQTPGVLQRSGLKNKHIGRHLRLHPCALTFGFFDQIVDPFEGSIMTTLSNVVENIDGQGYGCKLEIPSIPASSYASSLPWRGVAQHKEMMLRYRHCSSILALSRDKDSASAVRYDQHMNLAIDYSLSAHDRRSVLAGILRSADILVAAGAREIHTCQNAMAPFIFEPHEEIRVDNPRYVAWRDAVAKLGVPSFGIGIFAAHQMGTARMGISPSISATKPNGETWEVNQLFVADTSLFPTATGVNPMLTVEALALHIADCIIKKDSVTAKL